MSDRRTPYPEPGPDLLARYLNAYLHARQSSEVERPWGLGAEGLDALWVRLTEALATEPAHLNAIIARELSDPDRAHIVETLAPLIFALPLRSYPAELRGTRRGPRLVLSLRHLGSELVAKSKEPVEVRAVADGRGSAAEVPAAQVKSAGRKRPRERESADHIGHLPAALTPALSKYVRRVLRFAPDQQRVEAAVSSGGRRRRVAVRVLARDRGIVVRFIERLPSPMDEPPR
jgi:hypothetical protein